MLKKMQITNGRLVEVENGDGQVYVYIAPDESERRYLIDKLNIDEHTLNSSLDPDELSRLEFEPDHIAMIFKRPKHYSAEDNFLFKIASTGLFIFADKLIIVVTEDTPLFEGKSFTRLHSIQDVMLRLVYRSIVHFVEHLRGINMMSDSLEHQINQAMENKLLLNLFTLEKSLVYYLNAINSNGGLIDKLKNNAVKLGLHSDNVEFIDDMIIENNQCREQALIYSQVLAGLMDARASIVSNNLNIRIKTLTLITIAIMLPTFVVSLFSMNVPLPLPGHLRDYAFVIISILAGISSATVIFFWWNKKW